MCQTHILGVMVNPVIIKILAVIENWHINSHWDVRPNETRLSHEDGFPRPQMEGCSAAVQRPGGT